jgi:hypothetical protein
VVFDEEVYGQMTKEKAIELIDEIIKKEKADAGTNN